MLKEAYAVIKQVPELRVKRKQINKTKYIAVILPEDLKPARNIRTHRLFILVQVKQRNMRQAPDAVENDK